MAAQEHLLLASLGESPGALLSLFDWLNFRGQWPEDQQRVAPRVPAFSHVWVVTTRSSYINPERDVLSPLRTPDFLSIHRRVLVVPLVDINNDEDHHLMTEVLYRLVLQGEAWRNRRLAGGRLFSVALAGGRKTMSAALQQACTFFEVDNLFHMALTPLDGNVPREDQFPATLTKVRQHRCRHHPIHLSDTPSAWRPWLDELWQRVHIDVRLNTAAFPLSDAWTEETPSAEVAVPLKAPEHGDRGLACRLERVAREAQPFARQALGCGIGARFLRHDLAELVQSLAQGRLTPGQGLPALQAYLDGLAQFVDRRAADGTQCLPASELVSLIDQALVLAVCRPVPRSNNGELDWVLPGTIRVRLEGLARVETKMLSGISREVLLLVLRNLLANAKKHGVGEEWDEPVITVSLEVTSSGVRLTVANPVPRRLRSQLQAMAQSDGTLTDLLRPFRGVGDNRGDGLGLYTVQQAVILTRGAMGLDGPRLQPWPVPERSPVHFLVSLDFHDKREAV